MEELKTVIEMIARNSAELVIVTGKVVAVDTAAKTCTVERVEQPTLYHVRLQSIRADVDNYVLIVPAVESIVQCAIIENDAAESVIISYSNIESYALHFGKHSLLMNKDEVKVAFADKNLLHMTPTQTKMQFDEKNVIDLNHDTPAIVKFKDTSLHTVLDSLIAEIMKVKVVQGITPDVASLTQIRSDLEKVLKKEPPPAEI